jgi:hypothetical protein
MMTRLINKPQVPAGDEIADLLALHNLSAIGEGLRYVFHKHRIVVGNKPFHFRSGPVQVSGNFSGGPLPPHCHFSGKVEIGLPFSARPKDEL